jgi:CheY-like chemotaxis protein
MSNFLVLSVGSDARILDARERIFQSADYVVVSAMSIKEALYLLRGGDFDVIVLCHTVSTEDCQRLTSIVRASGSRIPIVSVASRGPGEEKSITDAVFDKDPAEFFRSLEDVLTTQLQVQAGNFPVPHRSAEDVLAKKPPASGMGADGHERATGTRHATLKFLERKRA